MLKRVFALPILAVVAGASGCATYMEGTDQAIPIKTDPVHAICDVYKDGKLIGATSQQTPVVYVTKSIRALGVTCSAPGYDTKTVKVISATSRWGGVSFWAWDLAITDWISGALNEYPEAVSIALNPTPGPTAERIRQSMSEELRTKPTLRSGMSVSQGEVRPGVQISYSIAGAPEDEPFSVAHDRNPEPGEPTEK